MEDEDVNLVAEGFLLQAKVATAVHYTCEYIRTHPQEVDGWYWYGVSLIFTRKYQAALEAFEQGDRLGDADSEILFGLGIAHYALGNYQLGGAYIGKFLSVGGEGLTDDSIMGRAAMLSAAGAFTAAILFLEYVNCHKPKRAKPLDECLANIYGDYMNYAFKERPRLGDTWFMMTAINPEDKSAVMELVKQLIGELSWGDAVYMFTKYVAYGCDNCSLKSKEPVCLECIAQQLLPPSHMFCPNLFMKPKI